MDAGTLRPQSGVVDRRAAIVVKAPTRGVDPISRSFQAIRWNTVWIQMIPSPVASVSGRIAIGEISCQIVGRSDLSHALLLIRVSSISQNLTIDVIFHPRIIKPLCHCQMMHKGGGLIVPPT